MTIQAYTIADNQPIDGASITLQDGVWYGYIGIGNHPPDEVYILETLVGSTQVPLTTYFLGDTSQPNYTSPEKPVEYDPDGSYTAIQYETEYHRYEATYSRVTIEGTEFLTVTNRRLGNIDLTVTKQWLDGEGSIRAELLTELEKTRGNRDPAQQLYLAIRLDFEGSEDYYSITRNGVGKPDSVTIGSLDRGGLGGRQRQGAFHLGNLPELPRRLGCDPGVRHRLFQLGLRGGGRTPCQ